jgi:hypothetical protein
MFAYCVQELHLSEDAAYKRIQAARVARQFPVIFEAVADGKLHLTGVLLLSPCLTAENAESLLDAAAYKTKAEIEHLLAGRFPRPELPARIEAVSPPPAPTWMDVELAPERVAELAPERVEPPGRETVAAPVPPPRVAPLAPGRYALQLTVGQEAYDDLRHAQALLGHQVPSGDLAQVFGRALKALIGQLEKTKFAATTRPHRAPNQRASTNPRHIPARVKRVVWERDGGRCTFTSATGRRCEARKFLEFDHIQEVARGGQATLMGIRLRCRAHNQYGAECTFGEEFMRNKREEARRASEVRRLKADARAAEEARRREAQVRARAAAEEVIRPLRVLGFRADEARRAAAFCESMPGASLETRVRSALSYLCPRPRTTAS